jgi:hypothetical protein
MGSHTVPVESACPLLEGDRRFEDSEQEKDEHEHYKFSKRPVARSSHLGPDVDPRLLDPLERAQAQATVHLVDRRRRGCAIHRLINQVLREQEDDRGALRRMPALSIASEISF